MPWEPEYVELAELKHFRRLEDDDLLDDLEMTAAIAAASRAVDNCARRQFGRVTVAEERLYTPRWNVPARRWEVETDDLYSSEGLAVHVDSTGEGTFVEEVTGSFRLEPHNASYRGRPWTGMLLPGGVSLSRQYGNYGPHNAVQVTALWGWMSVPATVVQATLIQASRFLSRRDSPFGIAGSPDAGSEMRLLAKADPDVQLMLRSYRRPWGVQ